MKILVIIFLLLFLINCTNSQVGRSRYETFKSQVSQSLMSNPPFNDYKKIQNSTFMTIYYPPTIRFNHYCGLCVGMQYDIKEFNNKYSIIKSNYHQILDSINEKTIYADSMNNKQNRLLPDINDIGTVPDSFLNKDVEFFVYKQEEGNFLIDKYSDYFIKNNTSPHGYSIGAVVSKQLYRIVYWLFIW